MSYISQSLGDTEVVIGEAKYHWLYTATAFLWLIIFGWVGIGILIFIMMMLSKWGTEFVVTNKRVILKRGIISRRVHEIDVTRIEGCSVNQGLFGRLFGYGTVVIRGTGMGEVPFPTIDDPLEFKKAIDRAKS